MKLLYMPLLEGESKQRAIRRFKKLLCTRYGLDEKGLFLSRTEWHYFVKNATVLSIPEEDADRAADGSHYYNASSLYNICPFKDREDITKYASTYTLGDVE